MAIRSEILALADDVVKKYPQNDEVKRQVRALTNSLDDTLSDQCVLEELTALKASGITFRKIFASLPPELNIN